MIPNVYLLGGAALVVLVVAAGAGLKGYSLGKDHVRAEYAKRDLDSATAYATKEREITDAYRKKEGEWAKSSAEASRKYQREIDKNATYYLTALATAPILRDPGTVGKSCSGGAAETPTNTGASSAGGNLLSESTSRFLWGEAAAADRTRIKLNSCIELLEQERR